MGAKLSIYLPLSPLQGLYSEQTPPRRLFLSILWLGSVAVDTSGRELWPQNIDTSSIPSLYEGAFVRYMEQDWVQSWSASFLGALKETQEADEQAFRTPEFQHKLWERDEVASSGLCTVMVPGAYEDAEVIGRLWDLRNLELHVDKEPIFLAKQLDGLFEEILSLVTPRHNPRKPSAKLVRIFAQFFPAHIPVLLGRQHASVVRRFLGLERQKLGVLGQVTCVGSWLTQTLGPVKELKESVKRSIFAWYLFELLTRDVSVDEETSSSPPTPERAKRTTRLRALSAQRKAIFYIPNAVETLSAIVQAAEGGVSQEQLHDAILDENPQLSIKSARLYVNLVRALDLLQNRGGVLAPTSRGAELLEGESIEELIAPVLIERFWGFAHLLRKLSGDSVASQVLLDYLVELRQSWQTTRAAHAILSWADAVGLVEKVEGLHPVAWQLTELGTEFSVGLPEDLSPWMSEPATDPTPQEERSTSPFQPADFHEIASAFTQATALERFIFPETFLALFHAALHSLPHKRFVLLSGLSGTGKTSLARCYAQAYCQVKDLPFGLHYEEIPVRPDWTDPSGLLGYFNPLARPDPMYQRTAALGLLMRACDEPSKPFFLCLDEMNLAQVEHYFAPLLSAMEGAASLRIHGESEAIDNIPPTLPWPHNLFIIGTVNMDETTRSFSDKVLDRAFTFELWDVNLDAWATVTKNRGETELVDWLIKRLTPLHRILYPARRHFGYRTCDELLGLLQSAPNSLSRNQVLDAGVMAKVLPKLRGDDSGPLPGVLSQLEEFFKQQALHQSAGKTAQMRAHLENLGVVRYFS